MGTNNITDTKVGQWDTAYSWGDHSTQNYLSGNIGFPKDLGVVTSSATTFPIGTGPNLGSIASGDTFIGVVQDLGLLSDSSSFFDSTLTLTNSGTDNSAGPILELFRDSSSPADSDYLGQIKFQGDNDAGAKKNYAKISGKILDASDGTEDGIIEFAFMKAGTNNISGRFRSDQLQLLNGTKLYIGGSGSIQFEGDSSNAHETTINVTEPTADRTITFPDSTGTVALTNSFTRFHSSPQTVTSSQETTNVSSTVNYTFSELNNAVHYNIFLNRTLLRPTEFSVSGTTLTVAVGILAQNDELEVTGFTV